MQIPQNWTFKSDHIADHFDEHVREQLPWYDLATFATAQMARHYVPQGGKVYDIGCATGNMGRVLAGTLSDREATLTAIDDSAEMVAKYEAPGEIVISKAEDFNYEPFDLAICFLTLMFIPLENREALLYELDSKLRLGGAIIVADKFEPEGGYLATAQWRLTLAGKCQAGVDPAEILEKEMSLVGVQRPTPAWMMRNGTEFFRFGDFRGYVIEGPSERNPGSTAP